MRRNEETLGGAEEAKVVIQKGFQTKQKKKLSRCSFRFPFTGRLDDHLSPPVCLLKKKILSLSLSLSLSVVLSSSSSLRKGEQQHKEMRREEEMTFSAKL